MTSFRLHARLAAMVLSGLPFQALATNYGPARAIPLAALITQPFVAMDTQGTARALWQDRSLSFAVHHAHGRWSTPVALKITGSFVKARFNASGSAVVVSYVSGSGLYASDLSSNGALSTPALVVADTSSSATPAPFTLLFNDAGAAAIVLQSGFAQTSQITAYRRPAGGTWGAAELVANAASTGNLVLGDATVGPSGDVTISYQSYVTSCGTKHCTDGSFTVHAAEEPAGTQGWQLSAAINAPASAAYIVHSAVSPANVPMLAIQAGSDGEVTLSHGPAPGWSAAAQILPAGSASQVAGIFGGDGGTVSIALTGYSTVGQRQSVSLADGSLTTSPFATPRLLSGTDKSAATTNLLAAADPAGAASLIWSDADGSIRAATRGPVPAGSLAVQTLGKAHACQILNYVCSAAAATSVNPNGDSVAAFLRASATDSNVTLYLTTTN